MDHAGGLFFDGILRYSNYSDSLSHPATVTIMRTVCLPPPYLYRSPGAMGEASRQPSIQQQDYKLKS